MAVVLVNLFKALKQAGVEEKLAEQASAEVVNFDNKIIKIEKDLSNKYVKLEGELNNKFNVLSTKFNIMISILIATFVMVLGLFIQAIFK